MPPRRVQTSPSPISAAPTPVPLSRRDPPPHQPSRGRQASPRWYNIPPPQWYVLSTPLTLSPRRLQLPHHPGLPPARPKPSGIIQVIQHSAAPLVRFVDALDTSGGPRPQLLRPGSPACAGIDLIYRGQDRSQIRFPRMRGDRPFYIEGADDPEMVPPHARG